MPQMLMITVKMCFYSVSFKKNAFFISKDTKFYVCLSLEVLVITVILSSNTRRVVKDLKILLH